MTYGGRDGYQEYHANDAGGIAYYFAQEDGALSDTSSEEDSRFTGQSVTNALCPTGEDDGQDNSRDSSRSASEIRAEIRETRRAMKERGLKETSFMNGEQSAEQIRGNEKLFALRTELEHTVSSTTSSKKVSADQVKGFLREQEVDMERLQASKLMADAATERFNKKYKTSLSVDEFKFFAQ